VCRGLLQVRIVDTIDKLSGQRKGIFTLAYEIVRDEEQPGIIRDGKMNQRRFRPTLDRLPSRITPSGYPVTTPTTAPTTESTDTTPQVSYPAITCCEYREPDDFYA